MEHLNRGAPIGRPAGDLPALELCQRARSAVIAASPPSAAVIDKLSRHKAEVLKLLRPAGNGGPGHGEGGPKKICDQPPNAYGP